MDVVSLIARVFGPGHDLDWFRWKHLDNPNGRSEGWVARDGGAIVGVRLFLRWDLDSRNGLSRALRPVDTATSPEARGSGVFRALTEHALAKLQAKGEYDLIFNTPNTQSRHGYQKMGWSLLPPIQHAYAFVRRRQKMSVTVTGLADGITPTPDRGRLHSARSPGFMRWRYDARSGFDYRLAILDRAHPQTGMVFRVQRRRSILVLLVCDIWGDPLQYQELVSGAARRIGAHALLFACGPGADDPGIRPFLKRGESVVAVKSLSTVDPDPYEISSWALSIGDLERVI